MHYAMIMAGGSGTRLWPMSREGQPKQLIKFVDGRCLLELAFDRLDGMVPEQGQYICAGQVHRDAISEVLPNVKPENYLAEPCGRDTLNAVGFAAAVISRKDPNAVMAVLTADHIIEPVPVFQNFIKQGFELAKENPKTLVTFGVSPTEAATGYGYLKLGEKIGEHGARKVAQFKEKPNEQLAQQYLEAGSEHYLWNSGMFVWNVSTIMDCIKRWCPANHAGLMQIARAWGTDDQDKVLKAIYPSLPKISIDYAVMEPASRDHKVQVAAVPMDVKWLDVGSWPSYGQYLESDEDGNAAKSSMVRMLDSKNTLIVNDDPQHMIATIGCEDLVVIHTRRATLICHKDEAQKIKALQSEIAKNEPHYA
ncbi:MAG: mannose-1-phosphate guanylyltransferase [Phycisphaeraceae bacterium JB051]